MSKLIGKFKNSMNVATISVYLDCVSINADPGWSYNAIRLSVDDLKKINKMMKV